MSDRAVKGAVVTGASSGIGRAIALHLAARGTLVLAVARRADALEALTKAPGLGPIAHPADLTIPREVRRMVEHAQAALPRIDVVIHSVGHQYPLAPVWEAEPSVIVQTINTMVSSAFLVLGQVLKSVPENSPTKMLFISSGAATKPATGRSLYSASKAALNQMMRVAAREVETSGRGQAVFAIYPGRVNTPSQRRLIRAATQSGTGSGLEEFRPEGVIEPDLVAEAVEKLLMRPPGELNGRIFALRQGRWLNSE